MRVHDLALDQCLSIPRGRLVSEGLRLLIDDRRLWRCVRRVRIRVIRISIIWISPVRIRQSGTECEGTEHGGPAPPAASTVTVMDVEREDVATRVAPAT